MDRLKADFSQMNTHEKEKFMSREAWERKQMFANEVSYDPLLDRFPYYGFKLANEDPFITEEELQKEIEKLRNIPIINLLNDYNVDEAVCDYCLNGESSLED